MRAEVTKRFRLDTVYCLLYARRLSMCLGEGHQRGLRALSKAVFIERERE